MFNKIPTELRKFEYPLKPHHLITTQHRNVTYIPIQQVRQPITEPTREVSIYPSVLQRQPVAHHVTVPPSRPVISPLEESKSSEPDIPFSPFTVNSKLENDIIERRVTPKAVTPLSKPSQPLERELSPIRNVQEVQVEVDPVVVNLSRSMEKRSVSSKKYPIFTEDNKPLLNKSGHKTPIFDVRKPSRSPHRIPIFKMENGMGTSQSKITSSSRHKIFELPKTESIIKSSTTQSNYLCQLNDKKQSRIFREPRLEIQTDTFISKVYSERQPLTMSPKNSNQQRNLYSTQSPLHLPIFHYPQQSASPPQLQRPLIQQKLHSVVGQKRNLEQPPILSEVAIQARKQGQSKKARPKTDPMMIMLSVLTLVTIIWLIYELFMSFG